MATPGDLEDHVSCPVCFEVYKDPHILKCLHTLCYTCIQQLQNRQSVKCPECREFSEMKDVRRDFKTGQLIDLYKDNIQVGNKSLDFKTCETCKKQGSVITCRCEDCDQYFCRDCELTHRGMKICKDHEITDIKDIIKGVKRKLSRTAKFLLDEKAEIKKKCREVVKQIQEINTSREKQLSDVDRFSENLMKSIQNHARDLKKTINDANDSIISNHSTAREKYEQSQKEIEANINLVTDIIEKKHISSLTDVADSVETRVRKNVQTIRNTLPNVGENLISPITVEQGLKWDPPRVIVNVSASKLQGVKSPLNTNEDLIKGQYSKLTSSKYRCTDCVDVHREIFKLCEVDGNIWGVTDDVIIVYNKNCERINTLQLTNNYCTGITRTHLKTVLTTYLVYGMRSMDMNGNNVTKICHGSFADIFFYNDKVYALDSKQPEIMVFKYHCNKWIEEHTISLKNYLCDRLNIICIRSDRIYISAPEEHQVYVYDISGVLLQQLGKPVKGTTAGKLRDPRLCGVDTGGNVLIADCEQNSLHVYTNSGTWKVVDLKDRIENPKSAMVDEAGEHIWIVGGSWNHYNLMKYTKV